VSTIIKNKFISFVKKLKIKICPKIFRQKWRFRKNVHLLLHVLGGDFLHRVDDEAPLPLVTGLQNKSQVKQVSEALGAKFDLRDEVTPCLFSSTKVCSLPGLNEGVNISP
jgi:hypothetical protein